MSEVDRPELYPLDRRPGVLLCGWPYPGGGLCKVPAPCPTHSGLVFGVGRYPSRAEYAFTLVDEIQDAEPGGARWVRMEPTPFGLAVELLGQLAANSQSAERNFALHALRSVRARQRKASDG